MSTYPLIPTRLVIAPKTPAPKHLDQIQTDAKERFAGILWVNYELDNSISELFKEYDNYELYDETKAYSKKAYLGNYLGKYYYYQSYLAILQTEEQMSYYVIAKRLLTEEDKLIDYCPCLKCTSIFFNPLKYLTCIHCVQCLKIGRPYLREQFLSEARRLKRTYQAPLTFTQSLKENKKLRILEFLIIVIIGYLFFS